MNKKIKKRWVKALRKGKVNGKRIVQAQHTLRVAKDDKGRVGLCCLGVLCELARAEGVVSLNKYKDDEGPQYTYNGEFEVLPTEVAEWAGLGENNPVVYIKGQVGGVCLSELNDEENKPFKYIADKIEEQL